MPSSTSSAASCGPRSPRTCSRRHDVTLEEVEGLIDILRRSTEAEVTCVLKEEADGSVRVSLRSLGDVDVRAIASDNGGGGHRFAAGFESTLDIAAVVEKHPRRALSCDA